MTRFFVAILSVLLIAGTAAGLQSNPLRDRLLGSSRQQETTGWYQRADTGSFFLFDRSRSVALLRERDDPTAEVLVLFPNRAPGGGTAFVTDTGREVIRLTGLGGATYFPADAPNGVIADFASAAGSLAPSPRSPEEVRALAEQVAEDFADLVGDNIDLGYAPAPRAGLGVQYDAFRMLAIAVQRIDDERRRVRGIDRVSVTIGSEPGAYRDDRAFVIVIAPNYGYAGRPSSEFIMGALLDGNA
ncbi:MAG: DUF4908 domain-containing protein [Alphaproteobacteria bacterium]|nr:DUF4908 domain-containing protein [Alphaproteobacteria bacterium]